MPTVRKHMARFSSPLLPESLLPVGNRALRYAEEEDQRQKDNAAVASLQAQVVTRPHDKEVLLKCLHLKEDYEDKYGTYIRDEDVESALAQRDSALDSLVQRRRIIANTPLWDTETIWDYVHDRDAFEEKYKTSTDIDDEFREDVNLKCASLLYYEELMYVADGDTQKASDLAGARFHIRVVNPFPGNDERRVSFDRQVRGWLKSLRRDNFEPARMVPTLERPAWNFLLPNPYPKCTDARLEYHCNRQVYRDFIETKVKSARKLASRGTSPPATISLAIFYTTFDVLLSEEKILWPCAWGNAIRLRGVHCARMGMVATVGHHAQERPIVVGEPIPSACGRNYVVGCTRTATGKTANSSGPIGPVSLSHGMRVVMAAEMAEMERRHVHAFLLSIAEAAAHYSLADLEWALEFAFRERLRRRGIQ
ncbi:hypothetical protein DFH07DRAFT_780239 [Mycena maculata]|uniref:Uncharacterized protein n=1 Tax=Mycena maculata TaxID=230809 RepID=A0AAD7MW80_9AGAR|nr:hypothetical protein DFH07DRAFT_780239 [Mycena maculata]